MRGIKSPFSTRVCQLEGVGWLGYCPVMIIKVSVFIIDDVRWEQNVGILVWLGENVIGCLLGIWFCVKQ